MLYYIIIILLYYISWLILSKKGKEDKIPLKKDDKDVTDTLSNKLKEATALRETAKSNEEKLRANQLIEEAKAELKIVTIDYNYYYNYYYSYY